MSSPYTPLTLLAAVPALLSLVSASEKLDGLLPSFLLFSALFSIELTTKSYTVHPPAQDHLFETGNNSTMYPFPVDCQHLNLATVSLMKSLPHAKNRQPFFVGNVEARKCSRAQSCWQAAQFGKTLKGRVRVMEQKTQLKRSLENSNVPTLAG